jgi:hypothetical protein
LGRGERAECDCTLELHGTVRPQAPSTHILAIHYTTPPPRASSALTTRSVPTRTGILLYSYCCRCLLASSSCPLQACRACVNGIWVGAKGMQGCAAGARWIGRGRRTVRRASRLQDHTLQPSALRPKKKSRTRSVSGGWDASGESVPRLVINLHSPTPPHDSSHCSSSHTSPEALSPYRCRPRLSHTATPHTFHLGRHR